MSNSSRFRRSRNLRIWEHGQRFFYNHHMNRRRFFLSAILLGAAFIAAVPTQSQDYALTSDPAPDKANPAPMQSFQLPSHGALLNAFVYIATGATPHPAVILLHGFPGNERNLDLAQSIRRAGWNVLYFDYRGSWDLRERSPSRAALKTHNPRSTIFEIGRAHV